MKKVGWIILVMMSIALLAIVGFLPSILALITFFALLVFWQSLTKLFPAESKFIGHALAIILLISLGYNLFDAYIMPKFPMLQTAAKRAQIAADLESSLIANPLMLKSRIEIANHLQWMQDSVGEIHGARLTDIRKRFNAGLINAEQAQAESLSVLSEIKSTQRTLAKQLGHNNYPWLIFLGVGLLAISSIRLLPLPGKGFWATIGILMFLSGGLLMISPEIADFFGGSPPAPSTDVPKTKKGRNDSRSQIPPPLKPPKKQPPIVQPPAVSQIPPAAPPRLRMPDYLSPALQQGIAEVAYKHNNPQQFVDQMFAGKSKQNLISNYSVRFYWVVDNEGFPRQTHQPGQIRGWKYYTNIGGRQVVFFYPADDRFYFGITDG